MIPRLICENVSIRGVARILSISLTTVLKKIRRVASAIIKPPISVSCKIIELDEVRTFVKKKENQYWVAYALCNETKRVIDFIVGKRTKRTLRMIVNTLLLSNVETIKTDRLNIYQSLIPARRHQSVAYNINHIEKNNLNLRTHLKRLSRRTIWFSRSIEILTDCLKIYFWVKNQLSKMLPEIILRKFSKWETRFLKIDFLMLCSKVEIATSLIFIEAENFKQKKCQTYFYKYYH